jgi:hypothetical protein
MRLDRDGPNGITPPKKISPWLSFLKHLAGLSSLMLITSAILSFILFAVDPSSMVNVSKSRLLYACRFTWELF